MTWAQVTGDGREIRVWTIWPAVNVAEIVMAAQRAMGRPKGARAAMTEFPRGWSLAPVVDALQALRGGRMVTVAIIMV